MSTYGNPNDYYLGSLPTDKQLTTPQKAALNDPGFIALSGGPGTGKSLVSLYRHIRNYNDHKRSLLLTYATTLQCYLQACCRSQNTDAAASVRTSLKGKPSTREDWAEIIVDEAQDLPEDYYYSIPRGKVSYGADDGQILYPERCCKQSRLREIYRNTEYTLDRNFRNTRSILKFCKIAFPQAHISDSDIERCRIEGEKPTLILRGNNVYEQTDNKQNDAIIEIVRALSNPTHNIGILVPWQRHVDMFSAILKEKNIAHTSYKCEDYNGVGCTDLSNLHIATFKSAKGLEFDTVIIPNFHNIDSCGNFNLEWQDFYVACTRAKNNLYIISAKTHSNLRAFVNVE